MTLEELIERARQSVVTEHERRHQNLSLAYSCLTRPSRAAFQRLAVTEGFTQDEFDAWAREREWWPK